MLFKLMLVSKDGAFQQCNEKGEFDDVTFFTTREEAERFIPSIDKVWQKNNIFAKCLKARKEDENRAEHFISRNFRS